MADNHSNQSPALAGSAVDMEVVCESCGGVVSRSGTSEVSLDGSASELPGTDLVREQMCSKQVLCWSCMNESITRLLCS